MILRACYAHHLQESPPFKVPLDAESYSGSTLAGYVSMTVLPQHVSSRDKIEKLAWVLLTLQAHLRTSIKDFKVGSATHAAFSLLLFPVMSAGVLPKEQSRRVIPLTMGTHRMIRAKAGSECLHVCLAFRFVHFLWLAASHEEMRGCVAQASLHAHMRSSLDELLVNLEKARVDTVEAGRPAAAAAGQSRRPVLPSKQGLLERLREKAKAPPVRDMRSMLNRYKENWVMN